MTGANTILIVGCHGQLGRALFAAPALPDIALAACDLPKVDIIRPESIEHALEQTGCDLVINAAAYTAVDQAESDPTMAFAVNAKGAGNLAAACARRGLPLMHISTDFVFDGAKAAPYEPQDPAHPLNQYGASKLAGEEAVAAANPRHVILRTAWLFSPYGHNFVKTMLNLADRQEPLRVVDDQLGCPTGAGGLARALLSMAGAILAGKQDGFGVFHYCGQPPVTWYELAQAVFAVAGGGPELVPIKTSELNQAAKRPAYSVLDCSHLTGVYGIVGQDWRPELEAVIRALR